MASGSQLVPILKQQFNAGVVSPDIYDRTNLESYDSSLAEAINVVIKEQGGISRRGGTVFIGQPKYNDKAVRFIPFNKAVEQVYMLEFGDLYIRVWTNRGQVIDAGNPYEIVSPYLETDLPNLKFIQRGDVIFLVDGRNKIHELTRLGHTNWTIAETELNDGPWLEKKDDITFTPSATTGTVTVTASANFFDAGHVGGLIKLYHGSKDEQRGWGRITAVASATSATVKVIDAFHATTASSEYREGVFSDYRGQPRAIDMYEDRLSFGGTEYKPHTLYYSVSGEYREFHPDSKLEGETSYSAAASDAIVHTMSNPKADIVQWMAQGGGSGFTGSNAGEFKINATNNSGLGIEPDSTKSKQVGSKGSSSVQALPVDGNILYVTRTGARLMELAYELNADEFIGNDLSIRTRNYFDFKKITKLAYSPEPISMLWVVQDDGSLLSCTYNRAQGIVAFTKQELGGTDVKVEDVEIQISPDTSTYDTWLVVSRTINGSTVKTVEYISDFKFANQKDWFFVDCGLSYSGTPVNTLSGFDHLEGETVSVLTDGYVHNDVVVTGGQVTLNGLFSDIHVGLKYTTTIKTLPLETGTRYQTTIGETKKITHAVLRIYESLGFQMGPDENEMEEAYFREGGGLINGVALPPYTGSKEITYGAGYQEEAQVIIQTSYPMPLNISSIILHTAVSN